MKYLLLLLVLAAYIYTAPLYPIYAQTTNTSTSSTVPKRAGFLQNNPNLASKAAEKRMDTKDTMASKAANLRMELKEKMASRAAALKEKLQAFKDKVKAQRVENINDRLITINQNRTDQMMSVLDRLTEFVDKIQNRIDNATGENLDKNPAKDALANAKVKIEAAKEAVTAQSEKDYTIALNTEATVKVDAQESRDTLHKDLKTVHDLVVEARKAVVEALTTALTTLKGGTNNGS